MLKGGGESPFIDRELPEDACENSLYLSLHSATNLRSSLLGASEVDEQEDPIDSCTPRAGGNVKSSYGSDDSLSDIPIEKELSMNYMAVPQHLFESPAPKSKKSAATTKTSPSVKRRRNKVISEDDHEDAQWGANSPLSCPSSPSPPPSPINGNLAIPGMIVRSVGGGGRGTGYAADDWENESDDPESLVARAPQGKGKEATRTDKEKKNSAKRKEKKEKAHYKTDKGKERDNLNGELFRRQYQSHQHQHLHFNSDGGSQPMTLASAIAAANATQSDYDSVECVSVECVSQTSTSPSAYDSSDALLKKKAELDRLERKRKKKESVEQAAAAAKADRKERKEREKKEKERKKKEKKERKEREKERESDSAGGSSKRNTINADKKDKEKEKEKEGKRSGSTRSEKRDTVGGTKADLLRETLAANRTKRESLNEYANPKLSSRASSDASSRSSPRFSLSSFSNSSISSGSGSDDGRAPPSPAPITEKGSAEIKIIHVKTLELCASLKSLILQVCKHKQRKSVLSKDDVDRLKYLYETVHLINFYVSSQSQENRKFRAYSLLLFPLYDALLQTHKMVTDIYRGTAAVTENFDVFELTLRRYLEQSNRLFPLEGDDRDRPDPPSSCIEDKKARQVWDKNIGADVYFTTFSTFIKKILEPEFPETRDESFQEHLQYFLNFPADDMLTVYKWNLLLRLFGPYDQFTHNFRTLVLERGFLGLINRIKAQEILLLDSCPSSLLLIRFSRTEPEYLAFSYKDERGQIRHSLNKEESESKLPVPVAEYVRRKFPRFRMVDQKVNVRYMAGIDQLWSLTDYARQASSNAYILPSLPLADDVGPSDSTSPPQGSKKRT